MTCQKCGAQLEEYMVFCDQCGAKVEAQDSSKKKTKKQKKHKSMDGGELPRKRRDLRWLVVLLVLALIGVSILAIYIYNGSSYYKDQYFEYLKYPGLLHDAEEQLEDAQEQLEEYEESIEFMDKYVRVVPNDDSGLFHRYGCEDLNLDSFWIYNGSAAESHGDPCPKCCGE